MKKIVGIHFRNAEKNYFYDPADLMMKMNDRVIAETSHGVEMGVVSYPITEMEDEQVKHSLGKVIRIATPEDIEEQKENEEKEREAYRIGKEKIEYRKLDMKLVQTEYTFDRNKLIFYFTADERVDFRELVKDLASVFRTRIELRQIGVRDETKILGGLGICGRELCCRAYLTDFAPVSMKMAKEQNLSLNPTKISGACGRLMCCLKNEEDTYEYLNRTMPGKGDTAITSSAESGVVIDRNILKQTVRVLFEEDDEREVREYEVSELTFEKRKKGEPRDGSKNKNKNKENKENNPGQGGESVPENKEKGNNKPERAENRGGHEGKGNRNRKHG
ncbi:MAG: stage 0 sporulation family protein, partial [Lachnospiraceae bacterium]|nr:stage 0 sporulation family protein [Lachnospiraceae bacterium]